MEIIHKRLVFKNHLLIILINLKLPYIPVYKPHIFSGKIITRGCGLSIETLSEKPILTLHISFKKIETEGLATKLRHVRFLIIMIAKHLVENLTKTHHIVKNI
jgi:hypothetical protein